MRKIQRQEKRYSTQIGFFVFLMLSISACGRQTGQEISEVGGLSGQESEIVEELDDFSWIPPGREWVYLSESILIEDSSAKYTGGKIIGDTYHYFYLEDLSDASDSSLNDFQQLRCCRYDLFTRELTKVQLDWNTEKDNWNLVRTFPCSDSRLWTLQCAEDSETWEFQYYFAQFDYDGNCLYSLDRTTEWNECSENPYLCSGTDSKGRLYEFDTSQIVLWEADGTLAGRIRHEDWNSKYQPFQPLEIADGSLIALFRWGGNGIEGHTNGALYKVNFDEKTLTTLADNMKEIEGVGLAPATLAGKTGYYDLVIYDKKAVYGYSLTDRTQEELFTWKECNLSGNGVQSMGTLSDGRLYAVIDDYRSDDHRIVLFTEISREKAPPMIVMTLATVGEIGDDLNATAMRFNRYHFPYRVEVKSYETVNDLYNALLAGERIDILDLSRIKLSMLTDKGLLEDLSPYLEKSESGYRREDFVEGILDAYTVDGILTGIPDSFAIRTVAGDISKYGDNGGGLTLDAFLSASEQNPNAKPLEGMDGLTREELMQYLMIFNMEEFVDWETGECRFDSVEFKRVLDCVKRFSEPMQNGADDTMFPDKIKSGEVLYVMADLNGLRTLNLYQELFDKDDVCIGFPTPDGNGGHLLITADAFGIMTSSRHKAEAWQFLESVIDHRVKYGGMDTTDLQFFYEYQEKIYPSLQKTLDLFVDNRMSRYTPSDWETNPSPHGYYLLVPEEWKIAYRYLSKEEMKAGPNLVKDAKPYFDAEGDAIIRIISEEAPAYYSDQKSLDAVAEIIQNRVKLYVMENR